MARGLSARGIHATPHRSSFCVGFGAAETEPRWTESHSHPARTLAPFAKFRLECRGEFTFSNPNDYPLEQLRPAVSRAFR